MLTVEAIDVAAGSGHELFKSALAQDSSAAPLDRGLCLVERASRRLQCSEPAQAH